MINNRQNGRRRGRGGGGQRPGGGGGGGGGGNRDNGNRIDNRARGNAAQLLEKYKSLARDAQMSGDRVNTEYYLQFADHYFRVLSDSRARQDEQRRQNGYQAGYDEMDEDFDDEGVADFSPQQQAPRREPRPEQDEIRAEQPRREFEQAPRRDAEPQQQQAPRRDYRDERPRREARVADDRPRRDDRAFAQPRGLEGEAVALNGGTHQSPATQPELPIAEPAAEEAPPRRRGRPRRDAAATPAVTADTFDAGALPPSIGVAAGDGDAPPKPRRRRVAAAEAPAAE